MGFFDKLLTGIAPGVAVRRQEQRLKLDGLKRARSYYQGATTSHRSAGWRPVNTDVNNETRFSAQRLRDVAREMVRNNPYASRAQHVIASNVIGTGIIPSIESPNGRMKARLEALLREHFDTPLCDHEQQNDLYGLQFMAMKCIIESGEVLLRIRPQRSDASLPLPFTLQVLEPDYLDVMRDGPMPNGNMAIQGIEFDTNGKRVAYWMWDEHPGTYLPMQMESRRIPAEYIIHAYRKDRPGQVRGVSWFAPVILRVRDFNDFADAQLMRQKIAACFTAFVTTDGTETNSADETSDATSMPLEEVEPGIIERLRPGEAVEFGSPPSTSEFGAYTRTTLQEIAAGLGISYEALTGDLTSVNFSSGRMGWLEFQRTIDTWRAHMLIPQFLFPIGNIFMRYARVSTGLNGTARVKWTSPRREMISPKDEIPYAVEQIRSGLLTRSEWLRRQGYDPEIVDAELAADNRRIDSLQLTLDSDPRKTAAARGATNPVKPVDEEGDGEDEQASNQLN